MTGLENAKHRPGGGGAHVGDQETTPSTEDKPGGAAEQVTVLECAPGKRAAKLITVDGISSYDAGWRFRTASIQVDGINSLALLLARLERQPRRYVVRARLIEGRGSRLVQRTIHPRRGVPPFFEPCSRCWVALDFDALPAGSVDPLNLAAVDALATDQLPAEFRGAAHWAALTGSAGFKPGPRARQWYWLDRPLGSRRLKRWLAGVSGLDHATLCDVSPIYTAAPLFGPGVVDPVPQRSALIDGEAEVVIPEIPTPAGKHSRRSENHFTRGPSTLVYPFSSPLLSGHDIGIIGIRAVRRPDRYAEACLSALARAPGGQGRERCKAVSIKLYSMAKAGLLDPAAVTGRIKRIMLDRGWRDGNPDGCTPDQLDRLLEWCWQHAGAAR